MKNSFMKWLTISICIVIAVVMVALPLMNAIQPSENEPPLVDIPTTNLAATYNGEIKDADGNLLVPFDVAYPEAFASGAYKYDENVLLLKMAENFSGELTLNLKSCGFASVEKFLDTAEGDWYRATLSEGADILKVAGKARSLEEILIVDFNYIYETAEIDYDEASFDCADKVKENNLWKDQYNLGKNNVQSAWKFLEDNGVPAGGSPSVIVAVIDTGVDYTHPDLKANMWVNKGEIPGNNIDDDGNGYVDDIYGCSTIGSTYDHTGDPLDDHGHGTHVAGIIAASNNKEGIVGIAYNAKIMAIKAGQASGVFTQADIAEAILYAYQMGADVINMSFGGSVSSIAVQDALSTAYTTATLVASAGNDGKPNENYPGRKLDILPSYPAALSYVIGVMSVDENGIESGFSNFDGIGYTSVEYEIYAPGEQIMSTLPDGRYGKLSGTSMAAPVVSAAAALLRSYYTDRDMYPSKFIAAQLCATSEDYATCCNPEIHGRHNIPMILDIKEALTKLPKPDVTAYDFYIFDPVSYDGVLYENNNGDGVADAGETLLIGLVLRNRWGASENTLVTVDALSGIGVANPYVEIIDGEVNFEGIGTYSTKSTLVYNEENIITGINDPIIIKLSKDCPNDSLIGINVYIDFENALDEKDKTIYHYGEAGDYQVNFVSRNGILLPSQIKEDMTLTKDNYYIIPNSAYVHEGVTVTVEPGTQIQFWSDDPNDPYAETYIAYLNVAGSFICQGSEDEPINLFPSEMMDDYRVEISGEGYIELNYTTVVNPYVSADKVDHCTFKYNYASTLSYRYLSDGVVRDSSCNGELIASLVENSLFYKCGSSEPHYKMMLRGAFKGCAFVDSNIDFTSFRQYNNYENCVFMGNNVQGAPSSLTLNNTLETGVGQIVRNSENGTTYIAIKCNNDGSAEALNGVRKVAALFGGDVACLETKEEWDFVTSSFDGHNDDWNRFGIGITKQSAKTWVNGTPIGDFIPKPEYDGINTACLISNIATGIIDPITKLRFDYHPGYYIIEIPGSVHVDTIYLRDNEVKIDDQSTYQIVAGALPETFDISGLIYVSEDENIATVSKTGLVTPVNEGQTRILVYSPDYMVCAALDLEVVERVAVSDVKFEDLLVELGEHRDIIPVFTPVNTTERTITYRSSDTSVVTVNEYGVATGVGTGSATIYATAQNGITYEIAVKVFAKIESISFENAFYTTYLGDTDEGWKPIVNPENATDYTLRYSTSDNSVAYVDDEGVLVRVGTGIATIRVDVEGTELYAEVYVSVSESPLSNLRVVGMDEVDDAILAVTSDGSLWVWGKDHHGGDDCCNSAEYWHDRYVKVPTKIADGVKSAVYGRFDEWTLSGSDLHRYVSYVNTDGELCELYIEWDSSDITTSQIPVNKPLSDLKAIYRKDSSFYALTEDGLVWAVGDNDYGQLGVGITTDISTPALCGIADVKAVLPFSHSVAMLKNNGELYVFGTYHGKYVVPHKLRDNVVDIRGGGAYLHYETSDGRQYCLSGNTDAASPTEYGKVHFGYVNGTGGAVDYTVIFRDGKVYYGLHEGKLVSGVENPVKLFECGGTYYILTETGDLYGFGDNSGFQLADLSDTDRYDEAKKIFFGINTGDGELVFESTNVTDGVLVNDSLIIDFSSALIKSTYYPGIMMTDSMGRAIYTEKEFNLDKLVVSTIATMVNGETYTITIPAGAFVTAWGHINDSISVTFTYKDPTPIELLESDLENESVIVGGKLDVALEYTFALAGDLFDEISLMLGQTPVEGFDVDFEDNVLNITAEGLIPGEYTLTIPAGAFKDNVGGVNEETVYTFTVIAPEDVVYLPIEVVYSSLGSRTNGVAANPQWIVALNKEFILNSDLITLTDAEGNSIKVGALADGNLLIIQALGLTNGGEYTLTVAEGAIADEKGAVVASESVTFKVISLGERLLWTSESFTKVYEEKVRANNINLLFYNNAVLNSFNSTNVETWLRITAASGGINDRISLGHNWWGTTNVEMVERQILDFDDYQSLKDIDATPYLTTAPENTFPFVTTAYLINSSGERVDRVGNETVTFVVEFNRDMNTSIPLRVRFGSSEPYAEYEIEGEYVTPRRWEGTYTLKTTIENGRQFIRIENGAAADDAYFILCETSARFGFELDTTAAQAMIMLGEATPTGIKLNWMQDDFDTLLGYNVYRSDKEDGLYVRLNSYVLSPDTKEFFDDTVEPGKRYYYNFTVVKTDLSESMPSGKITIMSMDTMAPNVYHSPAHTAYTGSNLLISATVTDNLALDRVILYYRTTGSDEWKQVEMSSLNSRYTGIISADHIDLAGLEYYIEARDGRNSTFKGSAENPYVVTVKLAVDASSLGDVDGDGVITNKDALMLLQQVNDLLNLTEDQFKRADLNGDGNLTASEALRILQYVSGKVTTIVG